MKLQSLVRLFALAAGLAAASSLWAHHSVSGVFDSEKAFEVMGVITEVEWINPHIYLHLDVPGEDGTQTVWRMETVPTAFLRKAGINKAMLMGDGEPVTITGIEAHLVPNTGWVHRITYADGHFYDISGDQ